MRKCNILTGVFLMLAIGLISCGGGGGGGGDTPPPPPAPTTGTVRFHNSTSVTIDHVYESLPVLLPGVQIYSDHLFLRAPM
jgi:hypothetical protein